MQRAVSAVTVAFLYAAGWSSAPASRPFVSSRSLASFFSLSSLSYRPSLSGSKYAERYLSLAHAGPILSSNDVAPTFLPKDSRPDPFPVALVAAGDDSMYGTPVA